MEIQTLSLPSILETGRFDDVDYFVRRTAFVICHKSEPVETLLTVLRYLPADSAHIIVTNCAPGVYAELRYVLGERSPSRGATYLIHQKDERIARLFQESGVDNILDASGRVASGKGEGMYIGALAAALLGTPEWLVYFDADNHAPSALLEYVLAMGQVFTASTWEDALQYPFAVGREGATVLATPLHAVRVCWASKPRYDGVSFVPQPSVMGRCTQVIAPLCDELLRILQPAFDQRLLTPNAGEQGMTMATAAALRYSSGFSIETFHLLELLFARARGTYHAPRVLLQQYLSGGPHLHEKKDDGHIKSMIAESLGAFLAFEDSLPPATLAHVSQVADELGLQIPRPAVYPALNRLPLARYQGLVEQFLMEKCPVHVPA